MVEWSQFDNDVPTQFIPTVSTPQVAFSHLPYLPRGVAYSLTLQSIHHGLYQEFLLTRNVGDVITDIVITGSYNGAFLVSMHEGREHKIEVNADSVVLLAASTFTTWSIQVFSEQSVSVTVTARMYDNATSYKLGTQPWSTTTHNYYLGVVTPRTPQKTSLPLVQVQDGQLVK